MSLNCKRVKSPSALTNAQRQANFRKNHRSIYLGESITKTIKRYSVDFDLSEDQVVRELIRFALCNNDWDKNGFPVMSK